MSLTVPAKTRAHLEWARVLTRLSEHCGGPVAAARALALDFPAEEAARAARQRLVTEARALVDRGRTPPVGNAPDVSYGLGIAARGGVLDPEDLAAVGAQLESAARCRRYLAEVGEDAPGLVAIAERLADLPDLGRALRDAFDERGELVDSASGELGDLRRRVAGQHEHLKQQVHGLLGDEQYDDMLQDEYFTIREDRYVLPIKSGHKRHVPGIVHGWSASGATVFIEPQAVVEANNRLLMSQAAVDREIRRVLTQFSRQVGHAAAEIRRSQTAFAELDLMIAGGRLSAELEAAPAAVGGDALRLVQARHPLLVLAGVDVVANDVSLSDAQRVLVITGPNTGGKTVALKTVGVCALMALAGLHIPADEGSRIPRFPGVFSDIGDEQSIDESRSTFSGHIANLLDILAALDHGALVLLDELAVGTDPVQGAALAQAVMEHLAERSTWALVTTHYESLKVLPFDDPRFRNGAVGFDPEARAPTYQLRLDVPGASSALSTARRLGLDPTIVDRATALAGPQQRRLEAVIEALERDAAAARQAKREVEAERAALAKLKAEAEARTEKLRARLRDGIARERDTALQRARKLRDEVVHLRKQLREPGRRRDADALKRAHDRAEKVIHEVLDARAAERAAAAGPTLPASRLKVGQRVWVVSLDNHAELLSLPDEKGRCEVRAGILTARVDQSDLRMGKPGSGSAPAAPKPRPAPRPVATTWADAGPQAPDNTVDVRGARAEEALEKAERFLDSLYERDDRVAFIIHGHGTGALKKAIRGWLRTCRYVTDQRPGDRHEGGDGVTAVLLA